MAGVSVAIASAMAAGVALSTFASGMSQTPPKDLGKGQVSLPRSSIGPTGPPGPVGPRGVAETVGPTGPVASVLPTSVVPAEVTAPTPSPQPQPLDVGPSSALDPSEYEAIRKDIAVAPFELPTPPTTQLYQLTPLERRALNHTLPPVPDGIPEVTDYNALQSSAAAPTPAPAAPSVIEPAPGPTSAAVPPPISLPPPAPAPSPAKTYAPREYASPLAEKIEQPSNPPLYRRGSVADVVPNVSPPPVNPSLLTHEQPSVPYASSVATMASFAPSAQLSESPAPSAAPQGPTFAERLNAAKAKFLALRTRVEASTIPTVKAVRPSVPQPISASTLDSHYTELLQKDAALKTNAARNRSALQTKLAAKRGPAGIIDYTKVPRGQLRPIAEARGITAKNEKEMIPLLQQSDGIDTELAALEKELNTAETDVHAMIADLEQLKQGAPKEDLSSYYSELSAYLDYMGQVESAMANVPPPKAVLPAAAPDGLRQRRHVTPRSVTRPPNVGIAQPPMKFKRNGGRARNSTFRRSRKH